MEGYFPNHIERICLSKGDDRIGRAFDEISWSPFLPLIKYLDDGSDHPHGLNLLATVYDAFECFVQRTVRAFNVTRHRLTEYFPIQDPPNASLRRRHILANLFPLAQALLECTPKRMLGHSGYHYRADLSLRLRLWDGAFDSNLPRRSASLPEYDLLHFHSTACLIQWKFERNHRSYSCTSSICLDEAELVARCSVMFDNGEHSEGGQWKVFKLLGDLDLTWMVGDLLSCTLDGAFPLRCAQKFARVTYDHIGPTPDSDPEDQNPRYGL